MRILFVVGQAALGGIETYCLRICRELYRHGHTLDVWFVKPRGNKAIIEEFRKVAQVRFLSRILPVPFLPIAPVIPSDCDLIFTTGRLSLIFGALAKRGASRPKLVAGVFSQWEYAGVVNDYKSQISHRILDRIGWQNLVFCTEGCRTFHLDALGAEISESLISPLLIQLPATAPRRPQRKAGTALRIVSVGNFTPFKTYHFTLPNVIAQLRDAGYAIEWTIFGDGLERSKIENHIIQAGVADIVRLAGQIDYARFPDEVGAADLYIGAGTTLIEASALGVPSVVAIDDNPEPTTPGYFCNRPKNFTSDAIEGEPLGSFFDIIADFAMCSEKDMEDLQQRSVSRAQAYSISLAEEEFQRIIGQTKFVAFSLGMREKIRYVWGVLREAYSVANGSGGYRVR
ncbi:MAG: glycosyltransferase [Pseudomonadota bacterium]